MLLLHPAQLGVAVLVGHGLHDVEGEGADLFDGVDRDLVLKSTVPSFFQEVIVDFSSAKQNLVVLYDYSEDKCYQLLARGQIIILYFQHV